MNGISTNKRSQLPVSIDAAGRIVLPTQAPGLIEDRGMLVYDNGAPSSTFDTVDWINRDRERRMAYVSGEIDEP